MCSATTGVPAASARRRQTCRASPPAQCTCQAARQIALSTALAVVLLLNPSSTRGQALDSHHELQQQRLLQHAACMPSSFNHTLLAALLGTTAPRPFIGAFAISDPASQACGRGSGGAGGGDGGAVAPDPGPAGNATAAAAAAAAAGPLAMDPWAYAHYNPQFGLWADALSQQMALTHYERVGRKTGYPVFCARIPVFISYPPRGGLCNMVACNLEAWTVAVALGADVLLGTVHKRDSFEHGAKWTEAPHRTLFHLQANAQLLAELGVRVAEEASAASPAGTSRPVVWTKFMHKMWTRWGNYSRKNESHVPHELDWLVPVLTKEVVAAARREQVARMQRGEAVRCDQPPAVHVHIVHTYEILRTSRLPLAGHLARGLRFSEPVEARVGLIAAAMEARGLSPYNGLHLRLEGDHLGMGLRNFGSVSALLDAHGFAMKSLGWGLGGPPVSAPASPAAPAAAPSPQGKRSVLPVYVASGLFTYDAGKQEYERAVTALAPFASGYVHKEEIEEQIAAAAGVGNATALPALDSEQAAAVDMLMLLRARQFVGSVKTTFSWFAAQKRFLEGHSARDTALAGFEPDKAEWQKSPRATLTYSTQCVVISCAD